MPWTGASVSEADWHWAVGIWEGEGSVGRCMDGKRTRLMLHVETTDRDMVMEWQSIMDLGRMSMRTPQGGRANSYCVSEGRRHVVAEWCRFTAPYIRTERKRGQALKTIAIDEALPDTHRRDTGLAYGRSAISQPPLCWKGLEEI